MVNTQKNRKTKIRLTSVKPKLQKRILPSIDENNTPFVVGIGASAGGLEAFKEFFENTPSDSGLVFIIVQHLDPTHKSLLSELIGEHTKMKVAEIKDGTTVKPNHVYVIPPNKDLKISNSKLLLFTPSEPRASRRQIDSFFISLAEDQKEKAIGIVLSGTGTEGTMGLKAIKSEGGMTMVQEPKSAGFGGMPINAIVANTADFVLPPDKMSDELLRYTKKRNNGKQETASEFTLPFDNELKKIFIMIRSQTGYDFSHYKTNTIVRRIMKRVALNQMDSISEYIKFLQNNPVEIEQLYKEFLIGVTSFFRDKDVFKSVEKKVIPYLLDRCKEKEELRVWVSGCSTGEEAYSLAILFRQAIEKRKKFFKVTIFASDIDNDAISFARVGVYPENISADISPELLFRYFIKKENHRYQLKKEIREMVIFAHQNIIKDPPFSKMDMISCRNLLIYMDSELQKKIIPIFHYSLNNEGVLLLGSSESVGEYSDMFTTLDSKCKIFAKKAGIPTGKPKPEYEIPYFKQNVDSTTNELVVPMKKKINITELSEKILLENYAPPSVIIDKNNNALYFSGNVGLYLEISRGEARLNIIDMAKKGLRLDLMDAIKKARHTKKEVLVNGVDVKVDQHFQTVNLLVKPVVSKETDLGALMIIFEMPEKISKNKSNKTDNTTRKNNVGVSELEKELRITKEHLQAAISELETSNEDLQTTNEEFQSSNEELQSTNEELETSREELQSVNEELITVNSELQNKIEQLSQANDDLNNLLQSIEVATVFLDRNLKIKRFTPTATKLFNLIPSDINRPVTHLASNILYKALADDVKNALKTLAIKTADVQAVDGTWYHMRILPYRTEENIIEGVLVTFVDITDQKVIEDRLKKTNEHLNLILENLPTVPYTCILEPKLKFTFVGKSCKSVTGFSPDQFMSRASFWSKRIHPQDKKRFSTMYNTIAKKGRLEFPFRWKCADGKYKSLINYVSYVKAESGNAHYLVGVWQEADEEKKLKNRKK